MKLFRYLIAFIRAFRPVEGWQDEETETFHFGTEPTHNGSKLPIALLACTLAASAPAQLISYGGSIGRNPQPSGGYARNLYPWYLCNTGGEDILYLNGVPQSASAGGSYSLNITNNVDCFSLTVGVIDTGCNITNNIVGGKGFYWQWQTGLIVPSDSIADSVGHGTSTVAILQQAANCKVIVAAYGAIAANEAVMDCIDYMVTNNVKLICLPWGESENNLAMSNCIACASNTLFICAGLDYGGNITNPDDYPLCWNLPNVLVVADLDRTGQPYATAISTNMIGAPGREIISQSVSGDVCYYSGTSCACPLVAGCAARLMARFPNQTIAAYVDLLRRECTPCDGLFGKLDCSALTLPTFTVSLDSQCDITVNGLSEYKYQIQMSSDGKLWFPVKQIHGQQPFCLGPPNALAKFYRAVL